MNSKQFVDADNKEVDPTNASYATEAGHAKSADTAKSAESATKAKTADVATKATSADSATKAAAADKASKADKLNTARKIAGHSFDGSGDVSISAGDIGAYNKREVDDKFNISTTSVNNSGFGFSIERQGKVVTVGITGITTTKFSNGWHTLGTIPNGYRPRSTRSCRLMLTVGNSLMYNSEATMTVEPNGTLRLRCYGIDKGWEIGGNLAWITT